MRVRTPPGCFLIRSFDHPNVAVEGLTSKSEMPAVGQCERAIKPLADSSRVRMEGWQQRQLGEGKTSPKNRDG